MHKFGWKRKLSLFTSNPAAIAQFGVPFCIFNKVQNSTKQDPPCSHVEWIWCGTKKRVKKPAPPSPKMVTKSLPSQDPRTERDLQGMLGLSGLFTGNRPTAPIPFIVAIVVLLVRMRERRKMGLGYS